MERHIKQSLGVAKNAHVFFFSGIKQVRLNASLQSPPQLLCNGQRQAMCYPNPEDTDGQTKGAAVQQ